MLIALVLGLAAAAIALWPIARRRLMPAVLRGAVTSVAKDISDRSLAKLPDQIHLARRTDQVWKDRAAEAALAEPLVDAGFEDAGTFVIDEMPGVLCRLLVHPADAIAAAIHEHPKAGLWLELVTRYHDGTTATFKNRRPSGIDPRPGHLVTCVPGAGSLALLERVRAERPLKTLTPISAATYPRTFEAGYAEHMSWRKSHGVSAREIAQVAQNRKAA
jgi:hypothetical protein